MGYYAIGMEWTEFAVRWLHIIAAIGWIGSSFYFIALDLGLRKSSNLPALAHGEEWQVHGGGFYHITKYLVAPPSLPEHLVWFKWESYTTLLSGFAMLALVYYSGADIYLVNHNAFDMPDFVAILVSIGSLTIGWIVYDFLCKSPVGKSATGLMLLLFVMLIAMAWGYAQVFTGRAALLHLGAFTGAIMTANVFFIIIPNQRVVVADLKAGRTPAAHLGAQAKQRSTHNNYLTLPVIFLMLSHHYPLVFATEYNWVIASLVFLVGVLVRHFFNTMHAGKGRPWWTWGVAAAIMLVMAYLSTSPKLPGLDQVETPVASAEPFLHAADFEAARDTVLGRCSMCHTDEPIYEGIYEAPDNIHLDTDAAIAAHAKQIALQAGYSHAMPPGNVTFMEPEERQLLVRWYTEGLEKAGRRM